MGRRVAAASLLVMMEALTTLGPLFAFMLIPVWIALSGALAGMVWDLLRPQQRPQRPHAAQRRPATAVRTPARTGPEAAAG